MTRERDSLLNPSSWKKLRHHATQNAFYRCRKRFIIAIAGRRSGKTEIAKRVGVREGIKFHRFNDGSFIFGAPVRDQAKDIYWEDLKARVPQALWRRDPRESDLQLTIVNGVTFRVVGMDEPRRIEGRPRDWVLLDEMDDMKPKVWTSTVRPALSTKGRPGRGVFIGRPKGRRHLWDLYKYATESGDPEWAAFKWKSRDIIDETEDASARRGLDPRTYGEEYDADFLNLEGRVYYAFDRALQACETLPYFDDQPIGLCLDFNVSPGVAEIVQEQRYWGTRAGIAPEITASIGEIWIRDDSNTRKVCEAFIHAWGKHKGEVHLHGDATGGARKTAATEGSDWDIVRAMLKKHFGERVRDFVKSSNPEERVRVNAANSRLLTTEGVVHWLIDPTKCPHLIDDFEGVQGMPDGSGRIDKDKTKYKWLSHVSDAVTYYVESQHPLVENTVTSEEW